MNSKRREGLQAAIGNNMDWYCAEADSWGIPYRREEEVWISTQRMPPFHSNLVCASSDATPYIDSIRQAQGLSETHVSKHWSIKDAYHQLELGPLGFNVLFDAYWYVCPPGEFCADIDADDLIKVHRVSDPQTFQAWIAAWGETPPGETIFVPALLQNPEIAMYYLKRGEEIVAGLCSNQSTTCVGVTNVFGASADLDVCYTYLAQGVPEYALVGYDDDAEVKRLSQLGAERVGELRIWQNKET